MSSGICKNEEEDKRDNSNKSTIFNFWIYFGIIILGLLFIILIILIIYSFFSKKEVNNNYKPITSTPIPTPTFQSPSFEDGGDTGGSGKANSLKDFFSDINLVEAAILGLGVATFLYAIYYYKFEMSMTKTGYAELNARLNKVEVMTSKMASEKNANGQNGARTRKRILM
jgi:magnesium-transporting ATPase (P-type)